MTDIPFLKGFGILLTQRGLSNDIISTKLWLKFTLALVKLIYKIWRKGEIIKNLINIYKN